MPILVDPPVDLEEVGPGVPGQVLQNRVATLGDSVLGGVDELGTLVYLQTLKGWSDSSTTGTIDQRAADHGGWADQAYLPPRNIEAKCRLVGLTFRQVSRSLQRLMRDVSLNDLVDFIVDDHGDQLLAEVRQGGEFLSEQKGAQASVSIALVAPDPRRYDPNTVTASTGLPQTTGGLSLPITLPLSIGATVISGSLQLVNEGNIPTRPVFAVAGPCPAFTITHVGSGRRLAAFEAVPAGRTLYLDVDRRIALLDGTAVRVVTGTWFELDPGVNDIQFSAATYDASALLTATFRSAWR